MFVEKANKSLSLYQITLGMQLHKIELSASLRISGPVAIGWGSLANPSF